jgi:hypothetical protein
MNAAAAAPSPNSLIRFFNALGLNLLIFLPSFVSLIFGITEQVEFQPAENNTHSGPLPNLKQRPQVKKHTFFLVNTYLL